MSTTTDIAEELRLQGNDAFSTKDWDRALDIYLQSVTHEENAKVYSNIAATLCKLGRYEEAKDAAKRATVLDTSWAKGWWRRGVVSELLKDYSSAYTFYRTAAKLEPKTKAFRKSLMKVKERLGVDPKEKYSDSVVVNPTGFGVEMRDASSPGLIMRDLYLRIKSELGGSIYTMYSKYIHSQGGNYPTSEQYVFEGIFQWIKGMQNAVSSMAVALVPSVQGPYFVLSQQLKNEDDLDVVNRAFEPLLGGIPSEESFYLLSSGMAHTGGVHICLEVGTKGTDGNVDLCSPQPPCFSNLRQYQSIAIFFSIDTRLLYVLDMLGENIKCSPAVISGSTSFWSNIKQPYPHKVKNLDQDYSPEECLVYVKKLLKKGKTWDTGVRQYCALQFRGTMLYAFLLRMMAGDVAGAYIHEKWALDFIKLVDSEFKVKEKGTFEEKGSSFRPSLRIGMMMVHFVSHEALRSNSVNGPYSMEMSMDLCMEISDMANEMDKYLNDVEEGYSKIQHIVASKRKPLAVAHSSIAHILNRLNDILPSLDFKQMAAHHGIIDDIDDNCDPYALIAKHYRIAAENELQDGEDAAIYWWSYAANMARASPQSGFTMGMVRNAIKKAISAERARDVALFGPDLHQGGTYEILAKVAAERFHDEDDSFVMPQVLIEQMGGKGQVLKIGDEVICDTFEYAAAKDIQQNDRLNQGREKLDNAEVEMKHGQVNEGVPSLETLCVRSLHRSGCEYAKGESDGVVIQHKAIMAAQQE